MAEATRSITFADLYQAVGLKFKNTASPTGDDLAACKRVVNKGYRRFLTYHDWSFLHPESSIVAFANASGTAVGTPSTTLTASTSIFYPGMVGRSVTVKTGTYTISAYTSGTVVTLSSTANGEGATPAISLTATGRIRMPDDFGYIEGGIQHDSASAYGVLDRVPLEWIKERETASTVTGVPRYFAVVAAARATTGQRHDLAVWPWPDTNYTLRYRYRVNPTLMTADAEYPMGGLDFGYIIEQFAMAEGELEFAKQEGPESQKLQRMLMGGEVLSKDGRARMQTISIENPEPGEGSLSDPRTWWNPNQSITVE